MLFALVDASAAAAQGTVEFPLALADSAPDWMVRLDQPTGCLASIPPSSMHRVPVILQASIEEHDDASLTLQTDLMAQDVADRIRVLLGAKGAEVPTADTNMAWYSVPTELVVVARRNGEQLARARRSTGDSIATSLLTRAFADVRASGEARIIWPNELKADSILVRLRLWPQSVGQGSAPVLAFENGMKFAAFYLTVPERTPPIPLPNQPPPIYPHENEWQRYGAYLVMQFVVDSTGRVDASTIRDLWPARTPRLVGYEREAYDEFVRSVRSWDTRLRLEPARIGPCAVRQLYRHPLQFIVKRR